MHTTSHTPNTFNVNTTDHTFVAMVGKHHVGVDAALNKQVREAGHEWPWCRHLHHTHVCCGHWRAGEHHGVREAVGSGGQRG